MDNIKPPIKSGGIPLLQKISGFSLTAAAVDAMLRRARLVSEGIVEKNKDYPFYNGSTLVTIDFNTRDFDINLESIDCSTIMEQARQSLLLRVRLMRLARKEAERRASPYLLRGMNAVSEFRFEDKALLVDIDIECPLADAHGLISNHNEV
jgi:hypothetical protein